MKIEIHKENGKSRILLDGKPVEVGCKGFEISSEGATGFATVTLKFLTKNLDFVAEVDDPIAESQRTQRGPRNLK